MRILMHRLEKTRNSKQKRRFGARSDKSSPSQASRLGIEEIASKIKQFGAKLTKTKEKTAFLVENQVNHNKTLLNRYFRTCYAGSKHSVSVTMSH